VSDAIAFERETERAHAPAQECRVGKEPPDISVARDPRGRSSQLGGRVRAAKAVGSLSATARSMSSPRRVGPVKTSPAGRAGRKPEPRGQGRVKNVAVRRLRSDEGAMLREVRLRALEDAPYALSAWFAREADYAPDVWQERAAQSEAEVWRSVRCG